MRFTEVTFSRRRKKVIYQKGKKKVPLTSRVSRSHFYLVSEFRLMNLVTFFQKSLSSKSHSFILWRFSKDSEVIIGRFFGDSWEILGIFSGDSQEILRRFSGDSQKILRRFSGDSSDILVGFLRDSPEILVRFS